MSQVLLYRSLFPAGSWVGVNTDKNPNPLWVEVVEFTDTALIGIAPNKDKVSILLDTIWCLTPEGDED